MRLAINSAMVNATTRYSVPHGLVYLNNPKVACSSIKTSLWQAVDAINGKKTYAGDPHIRPPDPFVKNVFRRETYDVSKIEAATFFSVVRNPYVRILSAYLDKVGRDPWIWKPFAKRFGILEQVTKAELSFRDFMVILNTEPDELLDVHFRPQYLNILWPICRPQFVGHMEDFNVVIDFLAKHDIPLVQHKYHATKSRELIAEYYTNETIELVKNKFAEDFRIFGYSTDIARVGEVANEIEQGVGGRDPLMRWIVDGKFPYDFLDRECCYYERFATLGSREERLATAAFAGLNDDNWERLQTYAEFAIRTGEYDMAHYILERIIRLTRAHFPLVHNPAIFKHNEQTATT